jgi:hypothetical protein
MAHATLRIHPNTSFGFDLHLLSDFTDIPSIKELVRQALGSPFGRQTFDLFHPPTEINQQILQVITECLFHDSPTVVRYVRLWRVGAELPHMIVDPPLAAFSLPQASCILHTMSLAGLRYSEMNNDFRAFVSMELDEEPLSVILSQLTEHGRWLFDQLAIIEMVSQEGWLRTAALVFNQFVTRIEQSIAKPRLLARFR